MNSNASNALHRWRCSQIVRTQTCSRFISLLHSSTPATKQSLANGHKLINKCSFASVVKCILERNFDKIVDCFAAFGAVLFEGGKIDQRQKEEEEEEERKTKKENFEHFGFSVSVFLFSYGRFLLCRFENSAFSLLNIFRNKFHFVRGILQLQWAHWERLVMSTRWRYEMHRWVTGAGTERCKPKNTVTKPFSISSSISFTLPGRILVREWQCPVVDGERLVS